MNSGIQSLSILRALVGFDTTSREPNRELIVYVCDYLRGFDIEPVLIWNDADNLMNGQPADLVLGQADFFSYAPNRGGAPAANTLSNPLGVFSDGISLWRFGNIYSASAALCSTPAPTPAASAA